MKGIDISNCNSTINFEGVKNDGVEAIIIKATEGVDFRDSDLEQNYNGVKSIGVHIGFYHFMSERTSPTQQAIDFYNAISDKEYDILPCLDIENNTKGRSATEISDRCIEFLEKFKELSGLDCMIYTGGYFGRDLLDSRVKQYKGWIAHYGVETPMETGFTVVGHQYSENGNISGISGNVDMNNFNEGIFISGNSSVIPNSSSNVVSNIGVVTASKLNVRNNPSTDSNIIGTLNNGDKVKIDKEYGDWYSIFYSEHGGYVSKEYVSLIDESNLDGVVATVTGINSYLNVRDSIGGNIIGKLYNGDSVKLFKKEDNYFNIYFGEHGGYVSADYITI